MQNKCSAYSPPAGGFQMCRLWNVMVLLVLVLGGGANWCGWITLEIITHKYFNFGKNSNLPARLSHHHFPQVKGIENGCLPRIVQAHNHDLVLTWPGLHTEAEPIERQGQNDEPSGTSVYASSLRKASVYKPESGSIESHQTDSRGNKGRLDG